MTFNMDDYVDVASRITQFKALYPDGSLQTVNWEIVEIGERQFLYVEAAAYRQADDERPGIGTAWEPFPGKTPYTRDSELMNAETSAWGRAIVALGIPTKKVASQEEVRNRQAEREAAPTPEQMDELLLLAADIGVTTKQLDKALASDNYEHVKSRLLKKKAEKAQDTAKAANAPGGASTSQGGGDAA